MQFEALYLETDVIGNVCWNPQLFLLFWAWFDKIWWNRSSNTHLVPSKKKIIIFGSENCRFLRLEIEPKWTIMILAQLTVLDNVMFVYTVLTPLTDAVTIQELLFWGPHYCIKRHWKYVLAWKVRERPLFESVCEWCSYCSLAPTHFMDHRGLTVTHNWYFSLLRHT